MEIKGIASSLIVTIIIILIMIITKAIFWKILKEIDQ